MIKYLMKQLLIFILTLSLNISLAQDTLPFKKRFYLELGLDIGLFKAGTTYYGHSVFYPGHGYVGSTYQGEMKNIYIAGSVGGFYKHRWVKLGVFYQGGWIRGEVFQHSVNVGGGFNTLGGLKKSNVWLGPFISIGGVVPADYTSYIESYRLDLGLDLYIRNFHIGYRHSWWNDGSPSKSLHNVRIDYLEFGYAIPLRKRENRKNRHQKTWHSSDTLPRRNVW